MAPVGGFIEPGEPPLESAQRELREETGYVAREWIDLGHYRVDPNRGAGTGYLWLAHGAHKVTEPDADDLEEQTLLHLTQTEVELALAKGEFKVKSWAASMAIALLYLARQSGDSINMETEEILEFPYVMFNNDWNFLPEYLDAIGNPPYKLIGNLDLHGTKIESLANLQSVDGNLNLRSSTIKSLGNLESVGGYLNLYGTKIESLGHLQSVGGDLVFKYTPLSETTTEEEIRSQVEVGGNVKF